MARDIIAILLGVLVLQESARARRVVRGMVLIAIGLLAINGRLLRRFRTKQPQPAE